MTAAVASPAAARSATTRDTLAEDVLHGLTRPRKELVSKHLYDARGSELFDQICEQPEYYQSRTERLILQARGAEIVAVSGVCELLELGSGSATKTRVLLDALLARGEPVRYLPLDVCARAMEWAVAALVERYPQLVITPTIGDFEQAWDVGEPWGPRLVAFLGGTLGNFLPASRRRFLRGLAASLEACDHVLLGVDLVKDRRDRRRLRRRRRRDRGVQPQRAGCHQPPPECRLRHGELLARRAL